MARVIKRIFDKTAQSKAKRYNARSPTQNDPTEGLVQERQALMSSKTLDSIIDNDSRQRNQSSLRANSKSQYKYLAYFQDVITTVATKLRSWYLEHHDVSSGDGSAGLQRIGCDSRDNYRGDKSADSQDQTSRKTSVEHKMNVLDTGSLLTFMTYRNHIGKVKKLHQHPILAHLNREKGENTGSKTGKRPRGH